MLLLFCQTELVDPKLPEVQGTVFIGSAGRFFTMGSTDQWAASDEKPPFRAGFTYNYRIDTIEVTVAHYWRVMHRLPGVYTATDTLLTTPVCHLSWFDAILFCNQRSLLEGLDTVYSYESVNAATDGRVYSITGLKTDLSAVGYRLPTEAEWEYAARDGNSDIFPWGNQPDETAAEMIAWFEGNSLDTVHPVASLKKNGLGIYDLYGNAAEWVNDWKGFYASDTLTDFIGPLGNDLDERPVKGGSYLHGIDHMRPSCRSDVYSTLTSTATGYIGFRCCIGKIKEPSRLNTGASIDTTNPVRLTSKTDFSWLPTRNTKIAFINVTQRLAYLCYSDFAETNPRVYQFTDVTPVYAPTISPDGNWVAFCTREEGQTDGSTVYIRHLDRTGSRLNSLKDTPAFIPRWWIDPQTADTFIVYTTSAVNNNLPAWISGQTKMQKISDGVPVGSPIILENSGSYHDGLSSDRRFLATGYTRLFMKDLVSGTQKTLFTAPQNGKPDGDTSQVCNVSISPDTAGGVRVMFLDFGSGSTPSTLLGSTYYTHQVLFVSDFSGKTRAWYRCPSYLEQWEHPEWSNNSDFAVAAGKPTSSPQHSNALYVLNLRDSLPHKCIDGTDLRQPYLWISSSAEQPTEITFDPDSAAMYNDPPGSSFQKNFAAKMPWFLAHTDSIEILALGSSRMQNGYAPLSHPGRCGYNFSYAAGGLLGAKKTLYNYAISLCPELKVVIISLDICWWNLENGDYSWNTGTETTVGYVYDRIHSFWNTGLPERFVEHAISVAEDYSVNYVGINALKGWYPTPENGWGPNPPTIEKKWLWTMNQNCEDNLLTLQEIARELSARSIHLIGVLFPQSPNYRSTECFGFEGPTRATAQEIVNRLRALEVRNDHFHLYDANLSGEHDYVPVDFFDESHLSDVGGEKFSSRFNPIIDSILGW